MIPLGANHLFPTVTVSLWCLSRPGAVDVAVWALAFGSEAEVIAVILQVYYF